MDKIKLYEIINIHPREKNNKQTVLSDREKRILLIV